MFPEPARDGGLISAIVDSVSDTRKAHIRDRELRLLLRVEGLAFRAHEVNKCAHNNTASASSHAQGRDLRYQLRDLAYEVE
jgi:hypothetical protein